jgi:thioesterase domain-containing protein
MTDYRGGVRAVPKQPGERSAVEIRRGNVVPAVFCVHSSTGGVAEFVALSAQLGEGQRFYGLQSPGLLDGDAPLRTVEELAASYLGEVRALQPAGPYLFAGWSMGGYVAVELARQAAAAGLEVGGVFLIAPPYDEPWSWRRARKETRAARRHLQELGDRIAAAAAPPGKQLLPQWDLNDDPLRDPAGHAATGPDAVLRWRGERVNVVNRWASGRYRTALKRGTRPYDGRVVLFVPDGDPAGTTRRALAQWRAVLRTEPEVVTVPGEHLTVIVGPGARAVGARLKDEIAGPSWPEEAVS